MPPPATAARSPFLATRRKAPRARGLARREQLLDAAWSLLAERDLGAVSLVDVAARAGVPVGSAYHYYDDVREVYEALAARVAAQLLERHAAPLRRRPRRWAQVIEELIDRGVAYFNAHPAAARLLIGPQTPPQLKFRDRERDRVLAQVFEAQVDARFELPRLAARSALFFRALEIADLMLSLSIVDAGVITPAMTAEAKRACIAYLGSYFPATLPRRPRGVRAAANRGRNAE